ncbi:MAG: hypothetical protein IPN89_15090 [Saprospiraceae bacterium]|nr:hypothetical protein [Saprospiraceae bacterium]
MEFYKNIHGASEGSPMAEQISHSTLLIDINPDLKETEFIIDGDKTVADFEKMMKDKFKLNVQVFRKSSEIWLQTTATDHWSLNKQNGKGQRSLIDYEIEPVDITDFDVD